MLSSSKAFSSAEESEYFSLGSRRSIKVRQHISQLENWHCNSFEKVRFPCRRKKIALQHLDPFEMAEMAGLHVLSSNVVPVDQMFAS
jgi:hypothetical protein